MMVVVEDISQLVKKFDKKPIENQVKLRLKLAGIKVDNRQLSEFKENEYPSILYVHLTPIKGGYEGEVRLTGYYISIKAARSMTFVANGKTYRVFASELASPGRTQDVSELREGINICMDAFLLAYLEANPKKKED